MMISVLCQLGLDFIPSIHRKLRIVSYSDLKVQVYGDAMLDYLWTQLNRVKNYSSKTNKVVEHMKVKMIA